MFSDLEDGLSGDFSSLWGLQAIRDGVIEASINHEKGYVQSKEMIDIYSTREPQLAFHQRISFCLDIHNMSVKVRGPELQRQRGSSTLPHPQVPREDRLGLRPGSVSKALRVQKGQRTWLVGPQGLCALKGSGCQGGSDWGLECTVPDLVPNLSRLPSLSLCVSICETDGEVLPALPTSQGCRYWMKSLSWGP